MQGWAGTVYNFKFSIRLLPAVQTKQRVSAFFSLQVLKENLKSKTKLKLTTTTTRTATTTTKQQQQKDIGSNIPPNFWVKSVTGMFRTKTIQTHWFLSLSSYFICHTKAWKSDEGKNGLLVTVPQEGFSKPASCAWCEWPAQSAGLPTGELGRTSTSHFPQIAKMHGCQAGIYLTEGW